MQLIINGNNIGTNKNGNNIGTNIGTKSKCN